MKHYYQAFYVAFFFFQVAKNSHYRPALVLCLSQLQVLDGVMVTLEERTRAELHSIDQPVRTAHNMHTQTHTSHTYIHVHTGS